MDDPCTDTRRTTLRLSQRRGHDSYYLMKQYIFIQGKQYKQYLLKQCLLVEYLV